MLKQDNFTREEIISILKLNLSSKETDPRSIDVIEASNEMINHLIDIFEDKNLAYNTETGFFDYIGPILPE